MGYKKGDISIDADFARFGGKSYAINKINSVEVREQRTDTNNSQIVLGIVGALIAFSGLGMLPSNLGAAAMFVIIGVGMVGLAIYFHRQPAQYLYTLFITTSSAEAQAMQTRDRKDAFELRDAIEAAVTGKPPAKDLEAMFMPSPSGH